MGWQEWISVLFSGVAAAVVGLVAAVVVYWLTQRHERHADEQRRLDVSVARISSAAYGIARSLGRYPLNRTVDPTIDLHEAILAFTAEQHSTHPAVCEWLYAQLVELAPNVRRNETLRWLPGGRARVASVVEPAVGIAASLHLWQMGQRSDSWFSDALARSAEA